MYQLGLVGFPVKHSLSPWIHGEFFKKTKEQGEYTLYEVEPNNFYQEVNLLKEKLHGFNITLPYKQKIIPLMDELDETAEHSGAVNTAVKVDNRWIGYNTDGIGYVRSLCEAYPNILKKDPRVLILGAGGAARGILHALFMKGIKNIDLANRSIPRANILAADFPTHTEVFSLEEITQGLIKYDLIIQTTSVGMVPEAGKAIIELPKLKEGAIVSDIVYQPIETTFLNRAKKSRARIHYGHTMLLYQALYAFTKWTGNNPSIEDLGQKLKQKLKGS